METIHAHVAALDPIQWQPHQEITNLRLGCIVCKKAEATQIAKLVRGRLDFNPHVCEACGDLPGDEIYRAILSRRQNDS